MKSKKPRIFSITILGILFLSLSVGITKLPMPVMAATTHDGDIIIDGSDVFTIKDDDYVQRGNIVVKDNGTLIVQNAFLRFDASYPYQYNLTIRDSARLMVNSGGIASPDRIYPYPQFGLRTMQRANVTLQGAYYYAYLHGRIWAYDNSTITGYRIQLSSGLESYDNSTVLFEDSVIWGNMSLGGRSRLVQRNSDSGSVLCSENASVWLEDVSSSTIGLVFRGNSTATFLSLPSTLFQYWSITENASSTGVGWNLTLTRTGVLGWSLYLQDSSVVTVKHADDISAYASDASTLILEDVTLFENHFRNKASGTIKRSRFFYFPLRATDSSSVLVQECELGWIDASKNASLTVVNSAKNPDIPYDTLTATVIDNASVLFQGVKIDYIDFFGHSSGVIRYSRIRVMEFNDYSTGVLFNSNVEEILAALKNASVFLQNSVLWGGLYARDSAVVRGLHSQFSMSRLTILDNATLFLDHYLTLNVKVNNTPLGNANATVFLTGQEPAVIRGTTNMLGWVQFTLTGMVVRSSGREALTYEIQAQYDRLLGEASDVDLSWSKSVTIELFDHSAPQISEVTWTPTNPSTDENVTVQVSANDQETHIYDVTLWFKTDKWKSLSMKPEGESWTATIPKQVNGTVVEFYVEVYDYTHNLAKTGTYIYTVKPTAGKNEPESISQPETGTDSESGTGNGTDKTADVTVDFWEQWWPWILLAAIGTCIALALFLKKGRRNPRVN